MIRDYWDYTSSIFFFFSRSNRGPLLTLVFQRAFIELYPRSSNPLSHTALHPRRHVNTRPVSITVQRERRQATRTTVMGEEFAAHGGKKGRWASCLDILAPPQTECSLPLLFFFLLFQQPTFRNYCCCSCSFIPLKHRKSRSTPRGNRRQREREREMFGAFCSLFLAVSLFFLGLASVLRPGPPCMQQPRVCTPFDDTTSTFAPGIPPRASGVRVCFCTDGPEAAPPPWPFLFQPWLDGPFLRAMNYLTQDSSNKYLNKICPKFVVDHDVPFQATEV